jgi:hypothetical protein
MSMSKSSIMKLYLLLVSLRLFLLLFVHFKRSLNLSLSLGHFCSLKTLVIWQYLIGVFGLNTDSSGIIVDLRVEGEWGQSCAITIRDSSSSTSCQVPTWNTCVSAQDHKSVQAIVGFDSTLGPNPVANSTRRRPLTECERAGCSPRDRSIDRSIVVSQTDNFRF